MACSSCGKRAQQTATVKLASATGPFGTRMSSPDLHSNLAAIPVIGATEPLLRNWKYRPPSGGWAVEVSVGGVTHRYDGTPRVIVQKITADYERSGRSVAEGRVWDFLNMIWMARDPSRSLKRDGRQARTEPLVVSNNHLENSPATFGPALWSAMSLFGMKDHFDKQSWLSTMSYVTRLLDPQTNPSGCSECYEKWTVYRLDNPPENIESEHQAALWIFELHNLVNKKLGKKVIPFEDAVRLNRWAFSLESGTAKPI